MPALLSLRPLAAALCAALITSFSLPAIATKDNAVLVQAQKQKGPLLKTLEELVNFESGSGDREGLDKISAYIAERLKGLGAKVEFVEAGADAYRMHDTPAKIGRTVRATFEGTGTKSILLIAHMDTVYLKGMLAKQPFRIEGDKAYGLGIVDDKAGVAVILHTMAALKDLNFRDYKRITVLINGDEEISSPGSRALIAQMGAEHDLTMSHEGASATADQLSLATAGIAAVTLKVTGRASHAGAAPERGLNAVYEIAHQMLQTRNFSDPSIGLKMNWTMVNGGTNRNVIPAEATAAADVRVERVADYDGLEKKIRETIKNQLIPETKVEMTFERRRPPMESSPAGLSAANHAKAIYGELGRDIKVTNTVAGGGTDAAFASSKTKNAVVERFGLQGFGAHSNDAEWILIDSIEPRLYMTSRLIMDYAKGAVK